MTKKTEIAIPETDYADLLNTAVSQIQASRNALAIQVNTDLLEPWQTVIRQKNRGWIWEQCHPAAVGRPESIIPGHGLIAPKFVKHEAVLRAIQSVR